MLALTRSTRAAHILSLHARALSTIAHSTGSPGTDVEQSSDDPVPAKTVATRQRQTRLANSSAEFLFVYPWIGIRSSAEGLAIARAVQEKYGPAKEVLIPRNVDSVNIFQPYFWLVFDDPNVRKRLPGGDALITLHVADLPRSDGNVGLEEMMHGLGLYTTDNKDPHHSSPHSSPPPTETDPSKIASDAPPDGYKTFDIRVEWAEYGPREVIQRKRVFTSHPDQDTQPEFAKAWLAFDGFSSESARGAQTPNLFRAREKWRKLAPPASAYKDEDDNATTAAEAVSLSSQGIDVEEVEAGTESMTETRTNETPSREWVPIIPSTLHSQQRPSPDSSPSKNIRYKDIFNASTRTNSYNSPFNAALATAAAEAAVANTTTDATPTPMPAGTEEETAAKQAQVGAAKLSRRERILNLARQNARTPLPKLPEKPQPPPEAEKIDEESERQGKERTIRERLWRLVGGNY
ncbi:hypothetical protein F5888DRAFT_1658156 [Russula emetica]|nr:hypothetical protein F5888DRAFT_1658156 [Russula emetica]